MVHSAHPARARQCIHTPRCFYSKRQQKSNKVLVTSAPTTVSISVIKLILPRIISHHIIFTSLAYSGSWLAIPPPTIPTKNKKESPNNYHDG
jgi:hypothetical protein